jgi:hypothetical protein
VASPCGESCQHPRMDGKPLIDSETISEFSSALTAFPRLADVAVIEHGAGQAGECLPGAGHTRQKILCELFARVVGVVKCGADKTR